MIQQRRSEIHKAFKSLEHALEAKEAELKGQLKEAQYPDVMQTMVSNSVETVTSSLGKVEDVVMASQAFGRLLMIKAQKELDRDPWMFVGKVAMCSIGLGLILGSRYRSRVNRSDRNPRSRGHR